MEPFKLRIKIGEHEFQAEGEQETVERQFETWREMITNLPSPPPQSAVPPALPEAPQDNAGVGNDEHSSRGFTDFDKVFRRDDALVTLSVLPRGETAEQDGALLILLGRRHYLNEHLVGGTWLKRGLDQSGMRVARVDRVFGDYMDALVTRVGRHRAVKYRLTNLGLTRAEEVARGLVKHVA